MGRIRVADGGGEAPKAVGLSHHSTVARRREK